MRKTTRVTITGLLALILPLLFLCAHTEAIAADSVQLTVSCSIPAIAGINVPLVEDEQIKTVPTGTPIQAPPSMVQQTDSAVVGAQAAVLVKTFYCR